jgi:hypothetical protein
MVTIIIGSSYDLIIEVQERVWYKLLPQSHSIGGELLPLHHVATGDGVDGVEGATGSGSSSVSPPILIVQGFVLCICVSLPPHYEITRGGVYSRFRSRRVGGAKVCSSGTHEVPYRPHHAARKLAHMMGALLALVMFHIDFFFSWSSISRKNDVVKRMGPFDILKVPTSQKQGNLCRGVKTKWMGAI